jgi:NAD(P)-dependent dehydrogenase (short-subunit alcohol dehydrogenase family)
MKAGGRGGSIVVTSSTSGNNGVGGDTPGALGYIAAKHAIVGLMRAYANYLAPYSIRVNSVHPTGVATPMIENEAMQTFLRNDPIMSTREGNALPVSLIEPVDISNAILWLVSDDARYVTGVLLPVDAGFSNKK